MQPQKSDLREFVFFDLSQRSRRQKLFTKNQVMAIVAYLNANGAFSVDCSLPTEVELQYALEYWMGLAKSAPDEPLKG
jgi:hypothetical protein